jgi:peptidoglycan/xylan/chitin deacetylase (PgdA/CDA1 family)
MAKTAVLRASLDLLYYSGASQAMRSLFGGRGAIFMLHHVRPGAGAQSGFAPNALLEVTPQFLNEVISLVKSKGFDLISMADAVARLQDPDASRTPFAVFTLDDAYRDNLVHALPVFQRHHCPFTIFASPAIQDGTCELWWRGLEAVIAGTNHLKADVNGLIIDMETVTDAQKQAAWGQIYWPVRNLEENAQRPWIRNFCRENGVDLEAICKADAMTWDELRLINKDPLCTIGGHTVHHYAVARLSPEQALEELVQSADRLEQELGERPKFFAYPYGDEGSAAARDFDLAAKAGYEAAVTTRKGMIFSEHQNHLLALPRLSLSGEFQKLRYVDVLLSGTAFALWNGFRKLNVS